jgi:hypothetical protein
MRTVRSPPIVFWMVSAFCTALCLAAIVIGSLGANESGLDAALQATARLSFLLFWPAYAGSAMAIWLGPIFQPLRQHGREFGMAFAAAHIVHLGLVGWLCWIGEAPPPPVFIIFGIAAFFTYSIVLFSFARVQQALGLRNWWLLRALGLNYVAYAFATDFIKEPLSGGPKHIAEYLPFAILAIAGPALRLSAFARSVARSHKASKASRDGASIA